MNKVESDLFRDTGWSLCWCEQLFQPSKQHEGQLYPVQLSLDGSVTVLAPNGKTVCFFFTYKLGYFLLIDNLDCHITKLEHKFPGAVFIL